MRSTLLRPARKRIIVLGLLTVSAIVAAAAWLGISAANRSAASGVAVSAQLAPEMRTGGRLWHFPAASAATPDTRLYLFNPTATAVGVWLRITGAARVTFQHVSVPPGRTSALQLSPLAPGGAAGALLLGADGDILPFRLAGATRGTVLDLGVPGPAPDGAQAVPLPAPDWHFPAISTPAAVVLVALYNPNPFSVQVSLSFAGDARGTARLDIASRASKEISFSATRDHAITAALTVAASGDIVPQRAAMATGGTRATYGTPEPAG